MASLQPGELGTPEQQKLLNALAPAANQEASVAADVATLKTNFNTLLASLKTAGLMVADT